MEYVIVANGDFLPLKIIREIINDKTIIALDGASNRLMQVGIKPDIVLGDLDSIRNLPIPNTEVLHYEDQNTSDLQKAIQYCDDNGAKNIEIICALGGRMDHEINNLRALKWGYKINRGIQVHSLTQSMYFIKDDALEFFGKINDYCGIFAFPKGEFTSKGLLYEGKKFPLFFANTESACNRLTGEKASVSISGEALLVIPGLYSSQRYYTNKSELEILKEKLQDLLDN